MIIRISYTIDSTPITTSFQDRDQAISVWKALLELQNSGKISGLTGERVDDAPTAATPKPATTAAPTTTPAAAAPLKEVRMALNYEGHYFKDDHKLDYGEWSVALTFGEHTRNLAGKLAVANSDKVSDARMALTALIEGLSALKFSCRVRLSYGANCACLTTVPGIINRGYKTAAGKPSINDDLIRILAPLLERHQVVFPNVYHKKEEKK